MEIKNRKKVSWQIAKDVTGRRVLMVNYYFIGEPGEGNPWVLVDAGIPESGKKIINEAESLFGENNPPQAIVLTHGYFDHIGALPELISKWPDVKVYAHEREMPYITGKAVYPAPDYLASGGGMALLSWVHPVKPLDLGDRAEALPSDGSIPHLPDWEYIHTAGYSGGHVSLFRKKDKVLLSGDAFISTYQNTFFSILTHKYRVYSPPAYYPVNYKLALESLKKLAALEPAVAGTGHGIPVYGKELKDGLQNLINLLERKQLKREGDKTPISLTDGGNVKPLSSSETMASGALKYISGFAGLVLLTTAGYFIYSKIRSKR
ncbi:MBL fold metallo-hydrolase [Cytophagaceae bacterium ABcell3]|nr:MBL fold metallo-hydrolase [Cytophagaceae bacterium ABcell3]